MDLLLQPMRNDHTILSNPGTTGSKPRDFALLLRGSNSATPKSQVRFAYIQTLGTAALGRRAEESKPVDGLGVTTHLGKVQPGVPVKPVGDARPLPNKAQFRASRNHLRPAEPQGARIPANREAELGGMIILNRPRCHVWGYRSKFASNIRSIKTISSDNTPAVQATCLSFPSFIAQTLDKSSLLTQSPTWGNYAVLTVMLEALMVS
jgi:hypothetical protein